MGEVQQTVRAAETEVRDSDRNRSPYNGKEICTVGYGGKERRARAQQVEETLEAASNASVR